MTLTPVHILAAVISSWRLTELLLSDRITQRIRDRFKSSYLLTCPKCLSVWTGIAATLIFILFPWANWPFALSWMYMWHIDSMVAKRQAREGRQLVVKVNRFGNVSIERAELSGQELEFIHMQMGEEIARRKSAAATVGASPAAPGNGAVVPTN